MKKNYLSNSALPFLKSIIIFKPVLGTRSFRLFVARRCQASVLGHLHGNTSLCASFFILLINIKVIIVSQGIGNFGIILFIVTLLFIIFLFFFRLVVGVTLSAAFNCLKQIESYEFSINQ